MTFIIPLESFMTSDFYHQWKPWRRPGWLVYHLKWKFRSRLLGKKRVDSEMYEINLIFLQNTNFKPIILQKTQTQQSGDAGMYPYVS